MECTVGSKHMTVDRLQSLNQTSWNRYTQVAYSLQCGENIVKIQKLGGSVVVTTTNVCHEYYFNRIVYNEKLSIHGQDKTNRK